LGHWTRPFAIEHGDLLAEREDFQSGVGPTALEDSEGCKE
jgi:hypothetical protein